MTDSARRRKSNGYVKRLAILSLLPALTAVAQTTAPPPHIIAAAELSGLFQSPENAGASPGVYQQLINRILEETGFDRRYELVVVPMKRAKKQFVLGKVACYAPGLDTFDENELPDNVQQLLTSVPMNIALVRVVSRNGESLVSSIKQIGKNDTISLVRGVPTNSIMQQMMAQAGQTFQVNSEVENLKMLASGRVNRLLVFYPDVLFAYKQLNIDELPYAQSYSPLVIKDNLVCHPQHRAFFDAFEKALLNYEHNGTLKQILGDYYVSPHTLTQLVPSAP